MADENPACREPGGSGCEERRVEVANMIKLFADRSLILASRRRRLACAA
jgi:hypothetical protein